MTTVVEKTRGEYAETAEFFMKFHGYVFSPEGQEGQEEVVSSEFLSQYRKKGETPSVDAASSPHQNSV